jgi:hypothetical protein
MRRLKRGLIGVLAALVLLGLSMLPGLFQGGPSPEDAGSPPRSGTVLTGGGSPAPGGTRVRARGGVAEPEVRVAPDGSFRFDPIPEGTERFEAVCGPLTTSVAGPPPVRIVLPGVIDVSGRIVAADTGEPVVDALVSAGDRTVRSNGRGRFLLAAVAVPDGHPPALWIEVEGFEPLGIEPDPHSAWDDLFLRLLRK